jgi:hypothetical protein
VLEALSLIGDCVVTMTAVGLPPAAIPIGRPMSTVETIRQHLSVPGDVRLRSRKKLRGKN